MTSDEDRKKSSRQGGRVRAILFRLGAVLTSLLLLALVELALRLFVPAPAINLEDPFVSFNKLSPLFAPDSTGRRFETAEERLSAFCPQSFAATKGPETLRVFCLGGSTVQGRPYSIETSFTTWLELNLCAARPGADSEVINCGGISYASYRLVPIMQELLDYEPDLFIVYTGHNEFLEDRTYEHVKKKARVLIRMHRTMLKLRIYALAHQFLSQRGSQRTEAGRSSKTTLSAEVRAKLDFQEGLKAYHRDETWREGTIAHFEHNLETMVKACRRAGVPIILVNPVSNLKDCPPFKSEYRSDLSDSEVQRVVELREQAGKLDWSETYGKIRLLEQAAAIDNRNAGLLFLLGKCNAHIGKYSEAKKWFVMAKEEDVCPLRILEPMHKIIREIAEGYDIPLVDVKMLIEDRTEDGIPGDEWLLDQVHPRITGHRLIADAIYEAMEKHGMVRTPAGWQAGRDELCKDHLSSLNEAYYARGAARLKRLGEWSRGRIPRE
jgi:lysophospholipase L1-like esterase